ncbi:YidC/Oxa1 family membrane protein insertase [Longimycelium tulufanense]|uniref:YidC/Oxa1 family membrane protein insertase n=1 Tax=Longimycelium tulufanense TaxID=907463 RepID=UPI00166E943A|nr:membrane protein insertase YidC [Longimycelium tulufanense]
MFTLLETPVVGAYHLVTALVHLTQPLLGPAGAGAAIVLFTAAVRLLLLPLGRAAIRGSDAKAARMPEVRELQERHKKDPHRLREEVTALYQRSGTSMYAGCLPMLLPVPVFTLMYQLFSAPTISGAPNTLLGQELFGVPLSQHWFELLRDGAVGGGGVFLLLFALLAVTAWLSSRRQARLMQHSGTQVPGLALLRWLPYGTVLAAGVIPLAAGVYLLTTTTWTLVERMLFSPAPAPEDRQRDASRST